MKKLVLILFVPFLFLTSCGVGDAEVVADTYHDLMISGDYETIVDEHISEEGLSITSASEWIEIFESIPADYGKIKSIEKKMGFNANTNNGLTTVTLRYTYTFNDDSELYERLILRRSNKAPFKIAGVAFNEDLSKLPMPSSDD